LIKYVAAALLLGVAVLITVDVTMRYFFNHPIIGVAEIVSNGIVFIAFLQLSYSVRIRGMLRSELLLGFLGNNGRIVHETVTCLLSILLFALIVAASWNPLVRSIVNNEFIGHASFQMPTWPLRLAIVACSVLAILNYILLMLRAILLRDFEQEASFDG
jgi:TRAP-type C4-dicarboxylate transport system permease small subunit